MCKRIFTAVVAGAFMSVAVALLTPASAGTAAAAAVTDLKADFNNDGVADLAVGAPFEDSTVQDSGAVNVIYGSTANGLRAAGNQLWTQDSPGILEVAEADDRFGSALAAGDFNGDSYSDLAIGVHRESIDGLAGPEGAVHVLYGSRTGLRAAGNQLWTQDSPGIGEVAETYDWFGSALAVGKLGRSAHDDLVIGVPGESVEGSVGPDGFTGSEGAVHVVYGSATGLAAAGSQVWTQNSPGIAETAEWADSFGSALAIGNFGSTTHDDLAVGVPNEYTGPSGVHVIYGAANGLSSARSQYWTQDSPGIVRAGGYSDGFGAALAAGNLGRSAYDDLAVGAPYESLGDDEYQGVVNVIYGTAAGLSAAGNQLWSQDSPGIAGVSENRDRFGTTLAIANFGKSAYEDLAIGVPDEDVVGRNDGGIQVIYGSAAGLTAAGSQSWHLNSAGIQGSPHDGDRFGAALAATNYGRSGYADLAVGVPSDEGSGGQVNVIYGSAGGLSSAGNQSWSQDSSGISGAGEPGDRFGDALAAVRN